MDAVKFMSEVKRMCESMPGCYTCPFGYTKEKPNSGLLEFKCALPIQTDEYLGTPDEVESMVNSVENWTASHPVKTNRDKFLEVFGALDKERFMRDENAWQNWLNEEYKGG